MKTPRQKINIHRKPYEIDHEYLVSEAWKIINKRKKLSAKKEENEKRRLEKKLISETVRDFYKSDSWRELRYKVLVKNGARCQCCGATSKDGVQIHVDHIKPRSKFPELQLDINNLQVLCEDCNIGKFNRDMTDWR